jgi:hypothetical protein
MVGPSLGCELKLGELLGSLLGKVLGSLLGFELGCTLNEGEPLGS